VAVLACAGLLAAGCTASAGRAAGGGAASPAAAARPAGSAAASGATAQPRAGRVPGAGQPGRAGGAGTAEGGAGPAAGGTGRSGGQHPAGQQLITVTAPAYGDTYASLSSYQWTGSRWRRVFGPWTARIGRGGLAPPGGKREGDGRTPSGTFGLPFLFGTGPDPGFALPYRQSYPWIAWDDDPASPRYNEWVDTHHHDPGASPEPMDVSAYVYGVVIGYNSARTPGLGSAIFLHASIGTSTAGCITLPVPRLLRLLRWLDPRRSPRISMGIG
jgi:L,D-peptidoglycan transpeptidase YkuD (ErfK/YbiS/YcfS/YnhG family)